MKGGKPGNLDAATVVAALETLNATYADRIAELFRNDVLLMFHNMDDSQFDAFTALDVPALMAWCASNPLPPGSSFSARRAHTQLANQELLVKYFREAAHEVRKRLATPSWAADDHERADIGREYHRLRVFLEQVEKTRAFPDELSRAALFEPDIAARYAALALTVER